MQVRVPEGVQPGALLSADVFGRRLRFPVPEGATTGQLLQLRLAGGIVTVALVVAAATATAAAAAATAGATAATASADTAAGGHQRLSWGQAPAAPACGRPLESGARAIA